LNGGEDPSVSGQIMEQSSSLSKQKNFLKAKTLNIYRYRKGSHHRTDILNVLTEVIGRGYWMHIY
jgi:hypothetical protein